MTNTVFSKLDEENSRYDFSLFPINFGQKFRYVPNTSQLGRDFLPIHIFDGQQGAPSIHHTYDGSGNLLTLTDQESFQQSFLYDGFGKRTHTINALGDTSAVSTRYAAPAFFPDVDSLPGIIKNVLYGLVKRTVSTTPSGKETHSYEDFLGRTFLVIENANSFDTLPDSRVKTLYFYNSSTYLLDSVQNPKQQAIKYSYDEWNRATQTTHPDAGTSVQRMNNDGQLRFVQSELHRNPIGEKEPSFIFHNYDDAGRLTFTGEAFGVRTTDPIYIRSLDPQMLFLRNPNITPTVHPQQYSLPSTFSVDLDPKTRYGLPNAYPCDPASPGNCGPEHFLVPGNHRIVNEGTRIRPALPLLAHNSVGFWEDTLRSDTLPRDLSFEDIEAYPEHVRVAYFYDNLPQRIGGIWEGLPQGMEMLTPSGANVENLRGRLSAIAYRDHGGQPFHYLLFSYDARGRVVAQIRYTENIGFDALWYEYNSADAVRAVRVVDPFRQYATFYSFDNRGRIDMLSACVGDEGTGFGIGKTPLAPLPLRPCLDSLKRSTISYSYNARNLLAAVSNPSGGSTYDYDALGRISQLSGNLSLNYVYDNDGRMIERGGLSFDYDRMGRLTDDAGTSFNYDKLGNRLATSQDNATYTYPSSSNRLLAVQGNSSFGNFNFSSSGFLDAASLVRDSIAYGEAFTYDYRGLTASFTRDYLPPYGHPLHRPACTDSATFHPREWEYRYRYSWNGEREQKREWRTPAGDFHGFLPNSGSCGEPLSFVHFWTYYLLSADKRQHAVYTGHQYSTQSDSVTVNTIDAEPVAGYPLKKEANEPDRHVVWYASEYKSYGPDGCAVTFLPDSVAGGWKQQYFYTDNVGSIRRIYERRHSGVTDTIAYTYSAFGERGGDSLRSRVGYIGKEHDYESGYINLGIRLYEPGRGLFVAPDPLWGVQLGHSAYHYSFNNPLSYSDPTGLIAAGGKDKYDVSNDFDRDMQAILDYMTSHGNQQEVESISKEMAKLRDKRRRALANKRGFYISEEAVVVANRHMALPADVAATIAFAFGIAGGVSETIYHASKNLPEIRNLSDADNLYFKANRLLGVGGILSSFFAARFEMQEKGVNWMTLTKATISIGLGVLAFAYGGPVLVGASLLYGVLDITGGVNWYLERIDHQLNQPRNCSLCRTGR